MPIPNLKFLNVNAGIPRKPVPLRYAVLITDMGAASLLAFLTGELHYHGAEDRHAPPLLTAYELTDKTSARTVTLAVAKQIYSQISTQKTLKTQLKQIPKSFYVWSDDLAEAFQHYIALVPGRENAYRWRLKLEWKPALGDLTPLIEECPEPENNGSQRAAQVAVVEQRNRGIIAEYIRIKSQNSQLSKSRIASLIAQKGTFSRHSRRQPQNLTAEAIRRILTRYL